MEEKKILQSVADTLIEKPLFTVTVTIKDPVPLRKRSIFDRLLRRPRQFQELERSFEIKPCVVGNMYRIAGRSVNLPAEIMDGSMAQAMLPVIKDHLSDVVYIVASGIQNTKDEPTEELISFINDNFDAQDLYDCLLPVLENLGMQSFLNSIALAKGTVKILKPASPLDGSE